MEWLLEHPCIRHTLETYATLERQNTRKIYVYGLKYSVFSFKKKINHRNAQQKFHFNCVKKKQSMHKAYLSHLWSFSSMMPMKNYQTNKEKMVGDYVL